MAAQKNQRKRVSSDNAVIVSQVFEKIAAILLRIGFDAPHSENLLRRAFISAATKITRASGRRSTQSQIALIAGVNRLDVRKLLFSQEGASSTDDRKGQSRVDRVLSAWRRDPKFSKGSGQPKELTFVGSNTQFEKLVRKYGRDVTARTLRESLIKNKRVIANGNRLTLVDNNETNNVGQTTALSDLNSLCAYLSMFDFEKGRRVSLVRKMALPVSDAKTLRLIQRKAAAKLEVALNALESLQRVQPMSTKGARRRRRHRLLITSTLSAESVDDF